MTDHGEPRAEEAAASLSVGDVVAERYRVESVLGEGGMGIVYRAEHLHLHKTYAVKVLLPMWSSMPEIVARFEREAVAAGSIQSAHVAAATDFGRLTGGAFFLVMEYVDGRTLRSVLDAGALEPERALRILRGILSGLQAAHAAGIVHRDLKPENVMLVARDGDPDFAKVLDFGIAKVDSPGFAGRGTPSAPLTRAGTILGTPDYMSPEQALGEPVDLRSDLYSAGVILFEMLAGRSLFEGGAVTVLRQHVMAETPELPLAAAASTDPRLAAVLRRMLAKTPENRFASAAEVLGAIDELGTSPGVLAPPQPPPITSSAQDSLRAVLDAGRASLRRALGRLFALLERTSPRRKIAVAAALTVTALTLILALLSWSTEPGPAPGTTTTAPAPSAAGSTGAEPIPGIAQTERLQPPPVTVLPPPPAPSEANGPATTARPTASGRAGSAPEGARRTGPGGIYIPPPSQWFR